MNKGKKEFLNNCKYLKFTEEPPILKSIYIIPTQYKHDSGFKIMYIVGEDLYGEKYILDTGCDVVNFGNFIGKNMINDLNIDINQNGIIHIWSYKQKIKCGFRVSSCTFEMID